MPCACAFRVRSFQLAAFSFWPVSICMFSMTLVWCIRCRSACVPYPDELRSLIQVCKQWTGHDIRARHSEEHSPFTSLRQRSRARRTLSPLREAAATAHSTRPDDPLGLYKELRRQDRYTRRRKLMELLAKESHGDSKQDLGTRRRIWLSAFTRCHTTACHGIRKLLHDVGKT